MLMTMPLVTCIMPTHNRRRFVGRAVEYFLRQDYEPRELLVVDDGSDAVADLMPRDGRVRYMRLPARLSVGAKRNLACEQAKGDIILHWDDDDWQAPRRVRYQVERLLSEHADVCGINQVLFYDCRDQSAWLYASPPNERFWLHGNSLCYRRPFWQRNPFADVNVGEDTLFIWRATDARIIALPDRTFHVSILHGENVSARPTSGSHWRRHDADAVRAIVGADQAFYDPGWHAAAERHDPPARDFSMRVAHESDLELPEFVAFREQQPLPRMRTWELPYALFAARLRETAAVLDCTINPCGFGDRLARLYPHVLYRHWNPVHHERLMLPVGVPDAAFDCVFCVNTLEHLVRAQRVALVADLARRLKPGGRLVVTSDFYFESSWSEPHLLSAGVVRADRHEVFNGFNKLTARDLVALCEPHGLRPLVEPVDDPREDDPTLFRNTRPYDHACIGGVFVKGEEDLACPPRTIVLALLAWNTCGITLDSVRAYLREARMLQRVGHQPFLCVCDNGSDDGTADALRALDGEIDVPRRFILNDRNRGSSIARNQMIDCAREVGADYILFMDGDIEIVPFSSVAMMRYLEAGGRWLGCIGANSNGQTTARERATPALYAVCGYPVASTSAVAWTQYGMFRRAMFEDGVRFDEAGPFGGPGWGFEDNDLAFQMEIGGYRNEYFTGMTYLHRAVQSSVRNLRRSGLDPGDLSMQRKRYVVDKWAGVPAINSGPLEHIRRSHQPV